MLKMPHSGGVHGYAIGVAVVNAQLIFDGAAGLYNGIDARVEGDFHVIGEWAIIYIANIVCIHKTSCPKRLGIPPFFHPHCFRIHFRVFLQKVKQFGRE
jgi:hypothetical protein